MLLGSLLVLIIFRRSMRWLFWDCMVRVVTRRRIHLMMPQLLGLWRCSKHLLLGMSGSKRFHPRTNIQPLHRLIKHEAEGI